MPKGSLLGQWTHVPVGTEAQKPYEMKISQNIEKKISTIKNSYLTKEKRNKFINLANVFILYKQVYNYILSVETMFSLSFVDRLFCCCIAL